MSIDNVSVRAKGVTAYAYAVVEWSGTGTTWTLKNRGNSQTLYTGTALTTDITVAPETLYLLRLQDDTAHTYDFTYVSPPLSAPVNLKNNYASTTQIGFTWMRMDQVDSYEVMIDNATVYPATQPAFGVNPTITINVPEASRTYEAKIRSVKGAKKSLWSPGIFATTSTASPLDPGVYEYVPSESRTYNPSGWLASGSDLIHGSGAEFGNNAGIHTTVFLYNLNTRTLWQQIGNANIISMEISLTRTSDVSDPRMVMSHWMLHNMTSIPGGAPTFLTPAIGAEVGSLGLGQQAWITLPPQWARALSSNTAAGVGWGGVANRFMKAKPITDKSVVPINGTIRITV